jgi:hypothetical protein
MQYFPKSLLCAIGSIFALASLANAQVSPSLPNPATAPNPLSTTIFIFHSNMQDKIMKSAAEMPESKYNYRPTKGRSLPCRDSQSYGGPFLCFMFQR